MNKRDLKIAVLAILEALRALAPDSYTHKEIDRVILRYMEDTR
jgi:hypothetical protein